MMKGEPTCPLIGSLELFPWLGFYERLVRVLELARVEECCPTD